MSGAHRYRTDMTAELLDRAAPQIAEALGWAVERSYEARRRLLPVLRAVGIALAVLGVVVADAAIVLAPDTRCARPRMALYYGAIPFFVIAGTIFGFLPSVTQAIRRWSRRVLERRARRLVERVKRFAPYEVDYLVSGDRIEARVERHKLVRVTNLRRIRRAVVAPDLACLFGRGVLGGLRRVVYFPDAAAREVVCEILRGAGVEVVEVE